MKTLLLTVHNKKYSYVENKEFPHTQLDAISIQNLLQRLLL